MQKDKFDMMTRRPVKPLICSLAVPTIVSMLVTSLDNMADTFFVGKINTQATAAVGVAFPLMAVVQAFGFFFGHGSGNYISRRLGARAPGAAGRMAATGFVSAFLCGLLVAVAGLLCLDGLCVALGSTPTVLPYTRQYVGVVLLGAPFLASSLVLNNQLRFQGNASVAMVGIVAGAAVNVGLDPLFIFTLDMGVAGAAWATVASQAVSFLFLFVLDRRLSAVPIRLRLFTPRVALFSEIVRGGSPSLARQGLACTATLLLNFMAGRYGSSKGSNRLFNMVRKSPVVFCPKGGKNVLDVQEAARGMVLAYRRGRNGENYLITGRNYSYRELFSDAAKALGRHPLLVTVPNFLLRAAGALGDMLHKMGVSTDLSKSNVTMLMINNHYNATKAEKELGFKAAPIDFKEMLSCDSGE